jgi:DNA repair exonuclease SbcCD ATPase subunit
MVRADKRGWLFPLLINLAAVLLIAAGVYLLTRYFELRRDNITLRRNTYLSAEGTLIQTLKQESANKLQAKDEEIASIRGRLQAVDQERQALKLSLEADLTAKEQELRRQMEAELETEKQRLLSLGTSSAGVADQIQVLERRQELSLEREIEQYRRQLDARLREKEQELLQSRQLARQALDQANQDRELLLAELRQEESERIDAEKRLTELSARIQAEGSVSASTNDSGTSAATAALEAELAVKTEEIEELQSQIRAIVQDGALLNQLQSRVDRLSSQLRTSGARVNDLNAEVRSLQVEREALSRSLQSAQSGQSDTFEQGRDDGLRGVMTFLNYLSGTTENRSEIEKQVLTLARQDPLYRAVTREIQILIAGGSSGELTSPFLFLGIVSSVSSGRVVVEAMVDIDVSAGSVIQIRRISDLDRELTIAEGTVQQVRGSKITATFKPTGSEGQNPAARDPVYVEIDGS